MANQLSCKEDPDSGLLASAYLDATPCFRGVHLFHAVVGLSGLLLFASIALLVLSNLYEPRTSSKSLLARSGTDGVVALLVSKVALQLSFEVAESQWALVAVLLLCAGLCCCFNVARRECHNQLVLKFSVVWNLVFLWSALVLFAMKAAEGTEFAGGVAVWALGLPFLALVGNGVVARDNDLLLSFDQRSASAEEALACAREVLLLVSRQHEDVADNLQLAAFALHHADTCPETDCPLRQCECPESGLIDPQRSAPALIEALGRQLAQAVRRAATVELRVAHASFLLEFTAEHKRAVDELGAAERMSPGFKAQFLIYRLRKMVEEGLGGSGASADDFVGMVALESNIGTLVRCVGGLAASNLGFWAQLAERAPELQLLFAWGVEVGRQGRLVEDSWAKLSGVSGHNALVLKLHARYQRTVRHDRKGAGQTEARLREQVLAAARLEEADLSDLQELKAKGAVVVSVFGRRAKAKFMRATEAFLVMLGIPREDLRSTAVHQILPEVYKTLRRLPQRDWLRKLEGAPEYLGRPHLFLLKGRGSWVFPATVRTVQYTGAGVARGDRVFVSCLDHPRDAGCTISSVRACACSASLSCPRSSR